MYKRRESTQVYANLRLTSDVTRHYNLMDPYIAGHNPYNMFILTKNYIKNFTTR